MSGHDLYNFPAFFEAEEFLKGQGWKVVNPARLDMNLGFDPEIDEPMTHEAYMKRDIPLLVGCDAIALLPFWQTSQGAKAELHVALICGLDVISAMSGEPHPEYERDFWRESGEYEKVPLATPPQHVSARGVASPVRSAFVTTAEARRMNGLDPESPLFEAHRIVHSDRGTAYGPPDQDFARTGKMWGAVLGIPDVSPRLVALCMVALKVSREAYQHKRDNLTDMAGYTETVAVIEGES